jgi:diguanylate cyclase (GGDEF)-like protein
LEFKSVVADALRRRDSLVRSVVTPGAAVTLKEARDRLIAATKGSTTAAVIIGGKVVSGMVPKPAILRSVDVRSLGTGQFVARVVVSVPFDRALVQRLSGAAPLGRRDVLAIAEGRRIVAGPAGLVDRTFMIENKDVTAGGRDYRAFDSPLVAGAAGAHLLALSPRSEIDRAVSHFRRYLFLAVAASLLTVALLAYTLGQPILRSLGELSRVARLADRDELTDLANLRGFRESLGHELRRADRFGKPVSLILTDLDDFKNVNDRHGHQVGDDVLKLFAEVLRAGAREVDLTARIGGEEFAVLLPETDLAGGEQLAERLRRSLEDRALRLPEGGELKVTASFGVASYPEAPTEAELQAAADAALYRVKAAGKNAVSSSGRAQV